MTESSASAINASFNNWQTIIKRFVSTVIMMPFCLGYAVILWYPTSHLSDMPVHCMHAIPVVLLFKSVRIVSVHICMCIMSVCMCMCCIST